MSIILIWNKSGIKNQREVYQKEAEELQKDINTFL